MTILPCVYQGNYSPIARHAETVLLPLLRSLKISFYAYSPIAGGFLVKDATEVRAKTSNGRFEVGSFFFSMYSTLYSKETMLDALGEWGEIAKEAGVSMAALAVRWAVWHSMPKEDSGDGLIIGVAKTSQLEETLKAVEDGPLETVAWRRSRQFGARLKMTRLWIIITTSLRRVVGLDNLVLFEDHGFVVESSGSFVNKRKG